MVRYILKAESEYRILSTNAQRTSIFDVRRHSLQKNSAVQIEKKAATWLYFVFCIDDSQYLSFER